MATSGKILWQDLTVEHAESVRDFYSAVVGWTFQAVDQGDYSDYNMISPNDDNEIVAGICHKRGQIANLPSQWLNYVMVADLEASLQACTSRGGKIIDGPKLMGKSQFAVIQDPAGAYLALMSE